MPLTAAGLAKLPGLLEELAGSVEQLLLTGLTTASESTRQALGVAFPEAARLRLLRLGATLRAANDELGRYTRNEAEFSRRRLAFFLNRAWLLSRGLAAALRQGDDAAFDRLLWTPPSEPLPSVEAVTLGVGKKVSAGSFVAFDFRLRTVAPAAARGGELPTGARLAWSCVFPVKPEAQVPPEGYLHLPQKQQFKAYELLEGKSVRFTDVILARDGQGGRVSLTDASRVTPGAAFKEWQRFAAWDPAATLARLAAHQPGPLDLDVELQEEVVLTDWRPGAAETRESTGQTVWPITAAGVAFEAVANAGIEGDAMRASMAGLAKARARPPLLALLHLERCRMVLQPLAVLSPEGPKHLMLSDKAIDRATLLKALKF